MNRDKPVQKCCPTDFVLQTLSTRWTLPLIKALAKGPLRPSELTKKLDGISAKSLTQRLRELESVGLLTRTAYQEIPPRVVYELTDRGLDVLYVLDALEDLGKSWQRAIPGYSQWTNIDQCMHCYAHLSDDVVPKTSTDEHENFGQEEGDEQLEMSTSRTHT